VIQGTKNHQVLLTLHLLDSLIRQARIARERCSDGGIEFTQDFLELVCEGVVRDVDLH
jgi:hypothetical protein